MERLRTCQKSHTCKQCNLLELCVSKLAPIATEMRRLTADPGHIDAILAEGSDRARAIAEQTMKLTRDIIGFVHKG